MVAQAWSAAVKRGLPGSDAECSDIICASTKASTAPVPLHALFGHVLSCHGQPWPAMAD